MFFNLSCVIFTNYRLPGAIFKLYDYDVKQTNEMKKYVEETAESSKVLESKVENLRISMESDMKAMKSELLSEIQAMRRWW